MPRRAAAGSRRGAELGAGLARVGGLEDFAAAAEFGLARFGAAGAVGQGFRAVHFVEVGFVDFGGGGTAAGAPLTPTLCGASNLTLQGEGEEAPPRFFMR